MKPHKTKNMVGEVKKEYDKNNISRKISTRKLSKLHISGGNLHWWKMMSLSCNSRQKINTNICTFAAKGPALEWTDLKKWFRSLILWILSNIVTKVDNFYQ